MMTMRELHRASPGMGDYGAVPRALRMEPRFVCWRRDPDPSHPEKPRKVLVEPRAPYVNASSTDPKTWGTFGAACAAAESNSDLAGIGFVLGGGFVGVDLDGCRDPENGDLTDEARQIVGTLASYTEESPSGTGLHILCRGALPPGRRKRGRNEMYERGRYFTVTGKHMASSPATVEERTGALAEVHAAFIADPLSAVLRHEPPVASVRPHGSDADESLLARARAASNGNRFSKLFDGDRAGYASASEADLALCSHLAYWTGGDVVQMDRLFRASGLCRPKWDELRGDTPYGARTLEQALKDRMRPAVAGALTPELPDNRRTWPEAAPAAFHGLAGDFVRLVGPASESDEMALLVQFLVSFGNAAGRCPCFRVEGAVHGLNTFALIVGTTGRGRKGTSAAHVRGHFASVDEPWARERIASGLASGEGLIYHVRDATFKPCPIREGKRVVAHEEQLDDPGVTDKRLLVIEEEFAATLRVMKRDGSTLSAILRQSWDSGHLRNLTKNSPLKATDAHISVVGHITADELRRELDQTEAANGFLNRFLLVCVRRSQCLPDGGWIDPTEAARLQGRTATALEFARGAGELRRDEAAKTRWHAVYPELSEGRPGLLGAVIGRAEAHVTRLACLYAVLDCSRTIRLEHLDAALALWAYCDASARFVFGEALGDPLVDQLHDLLKSSPQGVTRSQIRDAFSRNKTATELDRGLDRLAELGLAERLKRVTGGRPAEVWTLRTFRSSNGESKNTAPTPTNRDDINDKTYISTISRASSVSLLTADDQNDEYAEVSTQHPRGDAWEEGAA